MKQLVCEMCGSTNIIKQEGLYVCQSCGTKYSVDDARSMMVEGNVDVSGSTVIVDDTEEIANLYQLARRAKEDDNSENAAKYYGMILIKDPNSWEASFYQVYFTAMDCKIAGIRLAANSVENCLGNVIKLIKSQVDSVEEQVAAIKEVINRNIAIAVMLSNASENHYKEISELIRYKYTTELYNNMSATRDILYTCGDKIESAFCDDRNIGRYASEAWEKGIEMHNRLLPYLNRQETENAIILKYLQKIKKYNESFYNRYIAETRCPILEKEIRELREQMAECIAKTPTSRSKYSIIGSILLIWGIMLFVLPMFTFMEVSGVFALLLVTAGGIMLAIGIATKPSRQVREEIKERTQHLSNEISKREQELDKLKKYRK